MNFSMFQFLDVTEDTLEGKIAILSPLYSPDQLSDVRIEKAIDFLLETYAKEEYKEVEWESFLENALAELLEAAGEDNEKTGKPARYAYVLTLMAIQKMKKSE